MSTADEENPPVPSWLQKLEEQRENRLKTRLGHEAGAGAKCQKCEDKCPGLDLHFWRKICKICKCGKEDHDVNDEDIYGFVQFQLLGSRPVKSKGAFLKDRKDEVILEWTPKGSSNDVKKYLDELPADMLPIKGTEGAKIRKQRLQKQMPAHDIDASLCHQLTDGEIKEMEEYVSHIRKNCVGQGKIVRLSLFKGSHHQIPPSNQQLLSQIVPNQVASSQNVLLQSSDLSNNLHNLNIRDKTSDIPQNPQKLKKSVVANVNPQNKHQMTDHQNPINLGKITDLNYPTSTGQNVQNVIHPLTTSNVERHQEQYELQNANFDYSNYAPNFVHPVEQCKIPTQVGQPKDINYPVGNKSNVDKVNKALKDFNPNFVSTLDEIQVPTQFGQSTDLKYPVGSLTGENACRTANIDKIHNPLAQYNPNFINPSSQEVMPTEIGQNKNIKYPVYDQTENLPPINNATHPLMQFGGSQNKMYPRNKFYPQTEPTNSENVNYSTINSQKVPLQQLGPNFVSPVENIVLPTQIGGPRDLKYPSNVQNLSPNANQFENYANYGPQIENIRYPKEIAALEDLINIGGPQNNPVNADNQTRGPIDAQNRTQDRRYKNLDPLNPINANQIENSLYPTQIGGPKDINLTSSTQDLKQINPTNANTILLDPKLYPNQTGLYQGDHDLKNRPNIPILEAQNLINPLEALQNFQSVGYIHDINYPSSNLPKNTDSTSPLKNVPSPDLNSNQAPPKCHECGENFEDGVVAVSVERTEDKWHPTCFVCGSCKQPLVDLVYFYHKESNNIYCGRDYAILKGIPRCQACDELIFVREYCLAEENTFHVKHFCCYECDIPLAGKQYILENNQPVCIDCYENLKAECCQNCQNKIKPDEQGVSLQNLHWHANDDCFVCKKCKKSLLGGKMLLKNQQLFCSDVCYKSY